MSDFASNVVLALARVMADMPAIGKDGKAAEQQGGYKYRGIEQITAAAQPLLAKHGVVIVPSVRTWERDELTINGKVWHDERLSTTYRAYGPGGIEDYIDIGPVPSIGRDNADKGTNKALSQAYKYALIQALCIGDRSDDTDGQTHEQEAPRRRSPRKDGLDPAEKDRLDAIALQVKGLGADDRERIKTQFVWPWTEADCDAIVAVYHLTDPTEPFV